MATVAEVLVQTLILAGVNRIHGLPGDSLNGVTDSLRQHPEIAWVHFRNEEAAAFAAGAEAHLTGRIAVCAASCGPGNLHFINGLYDCHRSRVPVLAIASQIPSTELGTTYFQRNASGVDLQRLQLLLRRHLQTGPDAATAGHRDAHGYCRTWGGRDRFAR